MRRSLAALALALMIGAAPYGALAQTRFGGTVTDRSTKPLPVTITTGLTYQVILPAASDLNLGRQSLTIQNNQTTTDNCQILIGGPWQAGDTTATSRSVNGNTVTAAQGSILLQPGQAYTRYWPYAPNDVILGTCTSNGDSLYVDFQ